MIAAFARLSGPWAQVITDVVSFELTLSESGGRAIKSVDDVVAYIKGRAEPVPSVIITEPGVPRVVVYP